MPKQVAVIGAGITGLSAAYYLHRKGQSVVVYEASDRLGGKICTGEFAGSTFEHGADAFLTRVPWAKDLSEELGLDLVSPASSSASVVIDSVLKQMPMGPILGLPKSIRALVASGILQNTSAIRAYLDVLLPRSTHADDLPLADLVEARLGKAVVDRFTDPLLAGIYAGDTRQLSLVSAAPQLAEFASKHRSWLRGLKAMPSSVVSGPAFSSVKGGLTRLVEALGRALPAVHLSTTVQSLDQFDSVILTCPAFESARLLQTVCPQASVELAKISYASVALVCFAFAP
ncbi:MAG: protoporphyrinogen oxidase, partial [Actinomycetota bacterium]